MAATPAPRPAVGTAEQTEALISGFTQLQESLIAERAALRANDLEALRQAVSDKQLALSALHSTSRGLGFDELRERIAGVPMPERENLEARHRLLVQQAATAKDYNTVNGKIIQRSQQSIQAVLTELMGTSEALTYSESGAAERSSGGSAFAEA